MFEEDHPQSPTEPAQPKKRMGTAVMLAAGGVVVATLFATVASMLAASGREAAPERTAADVVQTITSVAPDGSTSTVVVTVSSGSGAPKAVSNQDRKQAAPPQDQAKPGTPDQPQLTTDPAKPTRTETESTPPPHTEPPTSSSTSSSTASSTTPPPSTSSSTPSPDPKP
ncbi:hypothetical protein [Lentzea cavernae]|uniref:hypothetical protein n=1 Tax=Lentzea cavernae TaxID=2020703 RepID=UPI00174944BF|nr:hypothetical protein [Lentzea cavernae]